MAPSKAEPGRVHLDTVLQQLGTFGRYQLLALALLAAPNIMEAIYSTHYIFSAEDVGYRCRIDECDQDLTNSSFHESWAAFAAPDDSRQQCSRRAVRGGGGGGGGGCGPEAFDNGSLVACHEWVYEDRDSFVSEFKLACEAWKRTLVGSVRSVGTLAGLLIAGQLSDRFGRKVMIYVLGTLVGSFGLAKTFSTSYTVFIVLEFLDAMFMGGLYDVAFVCAVELVSKEKRILFNFCLGTLYSIGGVFYAVIAWKVPYWRHQLRVIYAPAILLCLYAVLMDESVRWLLSKGKRAEAIDIIHKMARANSVDISNQTLANLQCAEQNGNSTEAKVSPFVETLRSRVMLSRLAICCVWWITCMFVYDGMTIDSVSLGGNKYVNFALTNIVDIPGGVACVFMLDRIGRKKSLFISFTATAVLCLSMVFVPKPMVWLLTLLYLIGKLAANFTMFAVYLYTSELFPTYTRNSMLAACSSVGSVGSIVAPQVPLLAQYWRSLPSVLYASCALTSALLTLLTPDTRQAPLPDTVLQAEHISRPEGFANRKPDLT